MRERGNAYRLLVGKPDGKRPLGDEDVGFFYNISL
jgi:hypothetical protein